MIANTYMWNHAKHANHIFLFMSLVSLLGSEILLQVTCANLTCWCQFDRVRFPSPHDSALRLLLPVWASKKRLAKDAGMTCVPCTHAHPNRYLQYIFDYICMLRLAIHVQSRRCQFSIVKDPQILVTISFLSNFSFGLQYQSYSAILAGASPTLLCAAEDAIRELTENWEPPPEGAGCIYQPGPWLCFDQV